MRSARIFARRALFAVVSFVAGSSVWSCASKIENCTKLAVRYEADLQNVCDKAPPAWQSGFCSVCAKARLYSYVKAPGGVCTCAPLTLTDGSCAGNEDEGALRNAIVAADAECATFLLDNRDAGAGDAGPDGGATGAN